jgi:hypothetical protein
VVVSRARRGCPQVGADGRQPRGDGAPPSGDAVVVDTDTGDDDPVRIPAAGGDPLQATRADVGQTGREGFVVLADPEGNEFCLLRTPPNPR